MQNTRYKTVRRWASSLLLIMVVLYVIARSLEESHVGWTWVRAFAEAGMIGALADWFAVVALFKHPLGLPIPHTAIVKKQKDRIGASLGSFVRNHFLSPEIIEEQVRGNELVKRALEWVSSGEYTPQLADYIERQIPSLIKQDGYEERCKILGTLVCEKLSDMPVERSVGKWMVDSMHGEEFRAVIAPLLGKVSEGISENKPWVKDQAGARAPQSKSILISKLTQGVTKAVSGHLVSQFSQTLAEASQNLDHSFYEKLEHSLQELGKDLQGVPESSEWARWKKQILRNPATQKTLGEFFSQAGLLLAEEKKILQSLLAGLSHSVTHLAQRFLKDPDNLDLLEQEVCIFISKISDYYGQAFEDLINTVVRKWDAQLLTEKIEQKVGADLQFIRINGSLIGGLIGLILHGIGNIIW